MKSRVEPVAGRNLRRHGICRGPWRDTTFAVGARQEMADIHALLPVPVRRRVFVNLRRSMPPRPEMATQGRAGQTVFPPRAEQCGSSSRCSFGCRD